MAKLNISRRNFLLGGSAALLGAGVSSMIGCVGTSDMYTSVGPDQTILTAGMAYSSTNFLKMSYSDALARSASWHVLEGLYGTDFTDRTIYNQLAIGDPVKIDDLTYMIRFNTKKKYSDGSFVKLIDITSAIGNYMSSSVSSYMFSFIKSVDEKDEDKIILNLNYPVDVEFLKNRLTILLIGKHGQFAEGDEKTIIGTGPYAYKEVNGVDGGFVEFIPNGNYEGSKPPRAKGMKWFVTLDDDKRVEQFIEGKTAVLEDAPIRKIDSLKEKGYYVDLDDSLSMAFLMFNTSHEPFNNKYIRQAILYSLNTEKYIEGLFLGHAEVPNSVLPTKHQNFHQVSNVYRTDRNKAKELLKQYSKEHISFNLLIIPVASLEILTKEIESNLSEIGIDCNISVENIRWQNISSTEYADKYDAILTVVDPSIFSDDAGLILSTIYGDTIMANEITKWSQTSPDKYQEMQNLLLEARRSNEKRQVCWDKAQELAAEEVPVYPLLHRKIATVSNPNLIKDFESSGHSGLYLLNAVPAKK